MNDDHFGNREEMIARYRMVEGLLDKYALALENCRLLAAKHRKEEWAGHVLRFCADAGVKGSILRDGSEGHSAGGV